MEHFHYARVVLYVGLPSPTCAVFVQMAFAHLQKHGTCSVRVNVYGSIFPHGLNQVNIQIYVGPICSVFPDFTTCELI